MSNITDKSLEAINAALIALTAINKSSELAKDTTDPKGHPMGLEAEIKVIHSIANEAVGLLRDHIDYLNS
jgi:hypothetical protein